MERTESHQDYEGITHYHSYLVKFPVFRKFWELLYCKNGIHLLDEVWVDEEDHYLICDVCGLKINIKTIEK